MNNQRCFVLFDLSLATLPVLLLARLFYGDLRFIRCSKRIKRHFANLVMRLGAAQLSEHDYYHENNFQKAQMLCIEAGSRNTSRNRFLADALVKYGGDQGYAEMLERAFVFGWYKSLFMIPFAVSGINDIAERVQRVDFFSSFAPHVFHWPEHTTRKLCFIKWHRILISPFRYLVRTGFVVILLLFPFLNAALYWKKGLRPRFGGLGGLTRDKALLFIHRHGHLEIKATRDIYLFRSGILNAGDCAHYQMATGGKFSADKIEYLKNPGGQIIHTSDIRPGILEFAERIFSKYYAAMFPSSLRVVLSREMNILTFRQLLEILHFSQLASMLVESCKPRAVYLEVEYSPIANIIAIEARKRGIRSASMIHGTAPQSFVFANRANLQFEYLITPGHGQNVVRTIMPRVKKFVAVGNHEVDFSESKPPQERGEVNLELLSLKENGFKIIGFFMLLRNGFIDTRSLHGETEYLDESKCRDHTVKHLKPLFDWVSSRQDIIFVWKPKNPTLNDHINHPWIAPLVESIPSNRLIVHPSKDIMDVIEVSDVCICQSSSSVVPASMAKKTPAISYDILLGGWTDGYHPHMAAQDGHELVSSLERLLEDGLPAAVFERFNADWYADGIIDFRTDERIASLFHNMLSK